MTATLRGWLSGQCPADQAAGLKNGDKVKVLAAAPASSGTTSLGADGATAPVGQAAGTPASTVAAPGRV